MEITRRQIRNILIREMETGVGPFMNWTVSVLNPHVDYSAREADDEKEEDLLISSPKDEEASHTEISRRRHMKITEKRLRQIIKEEKARLHEANPGYPKHMFPDRGGVDLTPQAQQAAKDLNDILTRWNNNPHLNPEAMRELPKHVRASLDDYFIAIEDVAISLRGE